MLNEQEIKAMLGDRVTDECDAEQGRVQTGTHYVDNHGQHYLPECLRDGIWQEGARVLSESELAEIGADECDEISRAARACGLELDLDDEGALVVAEITRD